jgi:hypothetical protein
VNLRDTDAALAWWVGIRALGKRFPRLMVGFSCAIIRGIVEESAVIAVSKLRVRRVKDVPLGHVVAVPHREETLLGIVVEAPVELKVDRLVLALAVDVSEATKVPFLLSSSAAEQCLDFGGAATFFWQPQISRVRPRWDVGLVVGHLAVTENGVAINGCFGRHHVKYAYWDVQSGRMVWDKYTMFLTEWQLRVPGADSSVQPQLTFPDDFQMSPAVAAPPELCLPTVHEEVIPIGRRSTNR